MEQESGVYMGNWLWGAIWVFYAYFYSLYFKHMSNRMKPDLNFVKVPGSAERLRDKQRWCSRIAVFMTIPTVLEFIRPSYFTGAIISLVPCGFGIWLMYSVWREVFRSQIPSSLRVDSKASHHR